MRELTKSALSLSWAMPLYGTQRLVRAFSPSSRQRDHDLPALAARVREEAA
jgi:hypothetical protein